jgi:hypothetical protein
VGDYKKTMRRLLNLEPITVHAGHDPSFGFEKLQDIAEAHLAKWANG